MTTGGSAERDVWAVIRAEDPLDPAAVALAREARRLARAAGGVSVALAIGGERAAPSLACAADRVLATPPSSLDAQIATLTRLARERRPHLVLVQQEARELMGPLAACLDAAVVPGCSSIAAEPPDRWTFRRPVYGGMASATLSAAGPVIASILTQALGSDPADEADEVVGVIETLAANAAPDRRRTLRTERLAVRERPLAHARVVVAGGLGLGDARAVALLEDLADALGGTIAGTRPVVDRGWLPADRQVGQSGAIIAPLVYVACGISGAPQHLAGVRRARTIIAINTDPAAPIMKIAHVPIVGDVRDVLPALTSAVRAAGQAAAAASRGEGPA